MAHARAVQPSNESTGLRPPSVRSPRVQPASAQSATGCVAALGSHRSAQKCLESSHERDRRDEQSGAASSLASSVPTSGPSGRRCSTCVCGASSATLLLPTQWSVCCIDQLNPPSLADQSLDYLVSARQKLSLIHISEPTRLLSISYAVFCLKK